MRLSLIVCNFCSTVKFSEQNIEAGTLQSAQLLFSVFGAIAWLWREICILKIIIFSITAFISLNRKFWSVTLMGVEEAVGRGFFYYGFCF